MNFLQRLIRIEKRDRCTPVTIDLVVNVHNTPEYSNVATKIVFSSFIVNNLKTEGIIMATTFGKAQKVPYTLAFTKADGSPTTDPVTNVQVTSGDNTVATVDSLGLFVVGVTDGATTITATGTNSAGATITGQVAITISDATPPPLPSNPNVATAIGIVLGAPVAQ
jgi:autotransporter adhesin